MTNMTRDRLKKILEAYGADPARWPADERIAAQALLETSADARDARDAAARLDATLGHMPAVSPSRHLREQTVKIGLNAMQAMAAQQGSIGRRGTSRSSASPQTAALSGWLEAVSQRLFGRRLNITGLYAGAGMLGVLAGVLAPTALTASAQAISNEEIVQLAFASNTQYVLDNSFDWGE